MLNVVVVSVEPVLAVCEEGFLFRSCAALRSSAAVVQVEPLESFFAQTFLHHAHHVVHRSMRLQRLGL